MSGLYGFTPCQHFRKQFLLLSRCLRDSKQSPHLDRVIGEQVADETVFDRRLQGLMPVFLCQVA